MLEKEITVHIAPGNNRDRVNIEDLACSLSHQGLSLREISQELGMSKKDIRLILKRRQAQNNRSLAAIERWKENREEILLRTSSPEANAKRAHTLQCYYKANPEKKSIGISKAHARLRQIAVEKFNGDFGHDPEGRLREMHLTTGHTLEEIGSMTGRMPDSIRRIMSELEVETGRIDQKSNQHFMQVQQIVWSRPESLQVLKPVERFIISRRYLENPEGYIPSFEDLSKELNRTKQAVHEREKTAVSKLLRATNSTNAGQ